MNKTAVDILMHHGVSKLDGAPGRGSGRYPLGSGKNPYQHYMDFLGRVEKLKEQGLSDKDIAKGMGLSTTQYRTQLSLAKAERKNDLAARARKLQSEGYNPTEIARIMGYEHESSIRALLNENTQINRNKAQKTAEFLKQMVDEKGMIDVGAGAELELGVSKERLNQALYILELQGYNTFGGGVPQVTNPGKQTNQKILCPPGTPYKVITDAEGNEIKKVSSAIYDYENIHTIRDYDKILTDDGTNVRPAFQYPESMDSKRMMIRYKEDGGDLKDGLIEIRPGVEDLSLKSSVTGDDVHYAQVRILVDGTHYIKGMAVYNPDLPAGVDVVFNTNKHIGTPALGLKDNTVLKPIKNDPENPFGSLIKEHGGQRYYDDPNGKFVDPTTGKKQSLSLINKRGDEGDWGEWGHELPSQFLAKQSTQLISKQLKLSKAEKAAEFEEIMSLTNPTIKKKLLDTFANNCDKAAVTLHAAALPREQYQVIMPLTTLKDGEIYAPNYRSGEKVALIRFPHGGTFEIPILKVNNKNEEGRKILSPNPRDAVGISKKTADILSGADFDGDTVMVIPINGKIDIAHRDPLFTGFDTKEAYGESSSPNKDYKRMTKGGTQTEMGKISNLITDMTIKGASTSELARAVKHSMVVIDAEKHELDYRRSYKENGIAELKKKYQGRIKENGKYSDSSSTLLSRAGAPVMVPKRRGNPIINPDGSLTYKEAFNNVRDERRKVRLKDPNTGRYLKDEKGNYIYKTEKLPNGKEKYVWENTGKKKLITQESTQMAEVRDAYELSSGHKVENLYADYANYMKAMANSARKAMMSTPNLHYNSSAKAAYKNEVAQLEAKLVKAENNKNKERAAQRIANTALKVKKQEYPDMTKKELGKVRQQEMSKARLKVGAKREPIDITSKEWEAIQAGAITDNKLKRILDNTDIDKLRQLATPRASKELSSTKITLIQSMKASGNTNAEIAKRLGVSTSTVSKYI